MANRAKAWDAKLKGLSCLKQSASQLSNAMGPFYKKRMTQLRQTGHPFYDEEEVSGSNYPFRQFGFT
ncbi:hypothetical protein ASD40_00980 [Paenibacillus sp. Root444D2]|nr:hypothetical protein ASD40_00980 [Paenibacillus sp. Root444D2]